MSTNLNNENLKRIFAFKNEKVKDEKGLKKMLKNKTNSRSINSLKTILKEFLTKIPTTLPPNAPTSSQNNKMHLFKWNAIYFNTIGDYNTYTKKYFEVYTSFLMLLSTVEQIKYFIEENKDELSINKEIRENINIRSTVFDIANISNEFENTRREMSIMAQQTPDVSYIFGKLDKKALSEKTQRDFNKYTQKPGLLSFESSSGSSKQTIFQILVDKYIDNKRLKTILQMLIKQYNLFKSKILQLLTSENGRFNYGLLAFGFLFSHEYFTPLLPNDTSMNLFTNKKLYDISTSNINIQGEVFKLNKGIYDIGKSMCSHINYFYNNGHKEVSFYEVLNRAIDMDLEGLRFALYYVHPDYLNLFLQRKEKIDKQLYAYLSSYDFDTEVPDFGDFGILSKFFEGNGLFLDFNNFDLL